MRILIVNDFASVTGGASRVALESAIGLAEAGQDVHVFAGAAPIDARLLPAGIQVTCLEQAVFQKRPTRAALRDGLWDGEARRRFNEVLAHYATSETIVHVHTNRDVLSASVPGLAIERGFSVVYTCHEYFVGCPYGAFFDQRLGTRCPERGMSFGCWTRPCNGAGVHKKLWSMTRGVMHQRAGVPSKIRDFVFVSDFSQRILSPYLPADAREHRVDNPVAALPCEPKTFDQEEAFLMVGGMHPGKNPLRAAHAAHALGTRVDFVGTGQLQEQLSRTPGANVKGWAADEQLTALYRASRALVFIPIWPETQGLVVFEAAAQGLPAIVERSCAAAEFVERTGGGILVDGREQASVEEAMRRLLDPVEAARLGALAYRGFWAQPPTLARHVTEILGVYQAALEHRVG